MRMVAYPVRRVPQQPAPQLRVVAVPDHNQIIVSLIGKTHNRLGRVPPPRLAANVNAKPRPHLGDLSLPLLETLIGPLLFALELPRQI